MQVWLQRIAWSQFELSNDTGVQGNFLTACKEHLKDRAPWIVGGGLLDSFYRFKTQVACTLSSELIPHVAA